MIQHAKFVQLVSGPSTRASFYAPALFALDADGLVWEFIEANHEAPALWRPVPMERQA